jgi:hypothetical protein
MKKFQCPKNWTIAQRLAHYSMRDRASGCLVWRGAVFKQHGDGRHGQRGRHRVRGRLRIRGRDYLASRLSWEEANGPIPAQLKVLHRCDNDLCIEPAHMFLGTNAANSADMVRKGRSTRGVEINTNVLTERQVRAIRKSLRSGADLARRYGVQAPAISKIRLRQNWRHVP